MEENMKLLIVGAMDSEIDFIKNKLENLKEEVHNNFVFFEALICNKFVLGGFYCLVLIYIL